MTNQVKDPTGHFQEANKLYDLFYRKDGYWYSQDKKHEKKMAAWRKRRINLAMTRDRHEHEIDIREAEADDNVRGGTLGKVVTSFGKMCSIFQIHTEWKCFDKMHWRDRNYLNAAFGGLKMSLFINFLLFLLMMYIMKHKWAVTTMFLMVFLTLSVLGTAMSTNSQVVLQLMIPTLFSGRMRWLLLSYISLLVMSTSGVNILRNANAIRASSKCYIDQMGTNLKLLLNLSRAAKRYCIQIWQQLQNAFDRIYGGIRSLVDEMTEFFGTMPDTYDKVDTKFTDLVSDCNQNDYAKRSCHRAVALLFQKIQRKLDETMTGLAVIFKPLVTGALQLGESALRSQCDMSPSLKLRCDLETLNVIWPDKVWSRESKRELLETSDALRNNLETDISFIANFTEDYRGQQQRVTGKLSLEERIKKDIESFLKLCDIAKIFSSIFSVIALVFLIRNAANFRKNWLTRDHFDNVFITPTWLKVEMQQTETGGEPVLPLTGKELQTYSHLYAARWTHAEWVRSSRGFGKIFYTLAINFLIMAIDYISYKSTKYTKDAYEQAGDLTDDSIKLEIIPSSSTGEGFSYAMLQFFTQAGVTDFYHVFNNIDAKLCSPVVSPPNTGYQTLVLLLSAMCFVTVTFETYILRTRHVIMTRAFPQRAVERAMWLRRHILYQRGADKCFYAAKSRQGEEAKLDAWKPTAQKTALRLKMMAQNRITINLLRILRLDRVYCRICRAVGNQYDAENFDRDFSQCYDCKSFMCWVCAERYHNTCLICISPINVMMEEVDLAKCSSDEECDRLVGKFKTMVGGGLLMEKEEEEGDWKEHEMLAESHEYAELLKKGYTYGEEREYYAQMAKKEQQMEVEEGEYEDMAGEQDAQAEETEYYDTNR